MSIWVKSSWRCPRRRCSTGFPRLGSGVKLRAGACKLAAQYRGVYLQRVDDRISTLTVRVASRSRGGVGQRVHGRLPLKHPCPLGYRQLQP